MSNDLHATTQLEAVNYLLSVIGELPVSSLDVSSISEATVALNDLIAVSREVQTEGLHCNSEEDYPLSPDTDGFIVVPSNVLKIDATAVTTDVVQRGSKLYDRTNHTYVFPRSVNVDMILMLDFEDLPQHVRQYVMVRAARKFQAHTIGSRELAVLSQGDEDAARALFKSGEMDTADYNIFNENAAWRVVNRSFNPRGVM